MEQTMEITKIAVGPYHNVVSVAAGDYYTVAFLADGSVVRWGNNNFGQCDILNAPKEGK